MPPDLYAMKQQGYSWYPWGSFTKLIDDDPLVMSQLNTACLHGVHWCGGDWLVVVVTLVRLSALT